MIRVLYQFKAKPGQEQKFEQLWETVSNTIRAKCPGAHGSVLLRGVDDPAHYIGVARWDSPDSWRMMRQSDVPNLEETEELVAVAQVLSVEITYEVKSLES